MLLCVMLCCYVILYCLTPCYDLLFYVMWCDYAILCLVNKDSCSSSYVMLYNIMLRYAMLYNVMLCYAMLCFVVSFYVMLCYAVTLGMFCSFVLCYATVYVML